MRVELLEDLYLEEISELLDGERQMVRIMPKIIEAVTLEELKQAFQEHMNASREHISRLEEILGELGASATGNKCRAMKGMIADIQEWLASGTEDRQLLETALIIDCQKIESYEVSCYAGIKVVASYLGRQQDAELLQKSYFEEQKMENKLLALGDSLTFEALESEAAVT
jgi:ferritin-like metal-binding protein YciE